MNRQTASQRDKYVTFNKAYETISYHKNNNGLLAAYVVAFSLIEDRVRAMFVVWHESTTGEKPNQKKIVASLSKLIRNLQAAGDIPKESADLLIEEAQARNQLIHAAMWNLNSPDLDSVNRVIKLSRTIDKCRRAQKKSRGM